MDHAAPPHQIQITVPSISGVEAAEAVDRVEEICARYGVRPADADALFSAMVTVYLRQVQTHGDRPPSACTLGTCGLPGDPRADDDGADEPDPTN